MPAGCEAPFTFQCQSREKWVVVVADQLAGSWAWSRSRKLGCVEALDESRRLSILLARGFKREPTSLSGCQMLLLLL